MTDTDTGSAELGPEQTGVKRKTKEKILTVAIAELRGVPATGGIFLKNHQGITLETQDAGETEYRKLEPGETQDITQAEYDALSDEARGMLRIV